LPPRYGCFSSLLRPGYGAGRWRFELELCRLHSACAGLEQSRVAGSGEGVDCHTGVWHHVFLFPARAPGHGDDHGIRNCGVVRSFSYFGCLILGYWLSRVPFFGLMITPNVTWHVSMLARLTLRGSSPNTVGLSSKMRLSSILPCIKRTSEKKELEDAPPFWPFLMWARRPG
jgi:hypothetical protein